MACSRSIFTLYTAHVISGLYHCSIILNVSLYDGAVEFYGLRVRQTCCEIFIRGLQYSCLYIDNVYWKQYLMWQNCNEDKFCLCMVCVCVCLYVWFD